MADDDDSDIGADISARIGRRLREARRRAKLSQEVLAERADLSVDVIRKIEQGRVARLDLQTYSALAAVLKVETIWFTEIYDDQEDRSTPRAFEIAFAHRTVELDFVTEDARLVRQTRSARVRAASANVRGFVDQMSTDGRIVAIDVRPGTYRPKRTEGGEMFLQIDFTRPLNKGEETDIQMRFDLIESFPDPNEEHWTVRVNPPTDVVRLIVRFHANRPYKAFRGFERFTAHEELYEIQPKETSDDERPVLDWEIKRPNVGCVYKLCWNW